MGNKQSGSGDGGNVGGPSLNFKHIPKLGGGGGQASVKELIVRAKRTGVLNLEKMGLKDLPLELMELSGQLRTLDLSHNKLTHLPEFIGSFTSLKQLILDHNKLQRIPSELGCLDKLESLSINDNELRELPETLGNLGRLKTISLQRNRLQCVPKCVCALLHIDLIDLSANEINSWPPDQQLTGLKAVELNVNQNRLSFLPDGLSQCQRLKVLRVEENCLPVTAFSPPILADSNISLIAFDGNLFQDKEFHHLKGYDEYMQKYTATKKKMF